MTTRSSRRAAVAIAALLSTGALLVPPAGAAPPASDADLIATVGSDNALWTSNTFDTKWVSQGGHLTSAPSVAYDGERLLYVGRGADANVWIRSNSVGWRAFGPAGTNCDGPTIAVSGSAPTMVAVACRGGDGAVWLAKTSADSGGLPVFSGWQRIGGVVKHGVTVSDVSPDGNKARFAFTATGGDNALWYAIDGGLPWSRLGGQCTAAAAESEFSDVSACRGGDGAVWTYDNSAFSRLGGNVVGKPAVTVYSDDSRGAYAVGTDGRVWQWAGGQSWTSLGGSARHGVAVITFLDVSP
jgi:hypothetical protein